MSPSTSSTEPVEPDRPTLLEVGYIAKAHGIRGEILLNLTTNRTERAQPGTRLTAPDGRVFEVLRSRPHQDKWIVDFGIADRNAAEQLRGTKLFAEAFADDDELWVHELHGATVTDLGGVVRGTVVAVEANPASDLLVLDNGTLVPVAFVVEQSPGQVVIDPPEGLFDL